MGTTTSIILAALAANTTEILLCYPLDTVKTRMQAQQEVRGDLGSSKPKYRGPLHCAVVTVQKEGWGALYRGIPCALAQALLWSLLLLYSTDALRRTTGATISNSVLSFALGCCVIGVLESLLLGPLDLLKVRLQTRHLRRRNLSSPNSSFGALGGLAELDQTIFWSKDAPIVWVLKFLQKQWSSVVKTARDIVAARGWQGLYAAWVFHLLKETVGAFVMLGVYDTAQQFSGGAPEASHRTATQHVHPQGLHWAYLLPTSCIATLLHSLASYPLDTLKTRLQADSLTAPVYRNSLQVAVTAWQLDSVGTLYRGVQASLCRAFPGSFIKVTVFELCLLVLDVVRAMPWTLDHAPFDINKLDHMEYMMI